MEKFNYGKYFYEHKIFDIDNKEERNKMSKAIKDALKIERYFFNIVPNIDKIKNIIAFSFKLNPYLNYIDRINYIRGIIYSMDYIDYNDVTEFYNLITDYSYVVDLPTMFKEKNFYQYENADFFDDLMVTNKLYGKDIFGDIIIVNNSGETTEDDEEDEEFDTNTDDCNVSVDENNEDNEDNEEIDIINITPKQKINLFKENFSKYTDMILECKNIDENKNKYAYELIILGMTNYFDFIIDILETINTISEEEKKCLRNKLSDFI